MTEPGMGKTTKTKDGQLAKQQNVGICDEYRNERPPKTPEEIRVMVDEELKEAVRVMTEAGREDLLWSEAEGGPIFAVDLEMKRAIARHCDIMPDYDAEIAMVYIEKLQRDVMVDRLTGISNRRQYDRDMGTRFSSAERAKREGKEPSTFAMGMVDIDFFHGVNSAVGHPIGDIFLQEAVRIIGEQLKRSSDQMYRYGGEEIAVVLPETNVQQAAVVMERVRSAVESQLIDAVIARSPDNQRQLIISKLTEAGLIPTTVSIGVSEYSSDQTQALDLFREADSALYRAKEGDEAEGIKGRNQVRIYDSSINLIERPEKKDEREEAAAETIMLHPSEEAAAGIIARYMEQVTDLHDLYQREGNVFYPTNYQEGLRYLMSKPDFVEYIKANPDAAAALQLIDAGIERLSEDARVDALTGLPNRRAFDEVFKQRLSEAARRATSESQVEAESKPRSMTVLLFDIDKFKRLNDSCGHHVGDECLRAIGDVLQGYDAERVIDGKQQMVHVPGVVRTSEFAARFDGEEFAVLLDTDDPTEIKQAAHRIGRAITDLVFNNREIQPGKLQPREIIEQSSYGLRHSEVVDVDGRMVQRTGRVYELMKKKNLDPRELEQDRDVISISIGAYTVEMTPEQVTREDGGGEMTLFKTEHEINIMQRADLAMYIAKGDEPESADDIDLRYLLSPWHPTDNPDGNCGDTSSGRNRFVFIDDNMRQAIRQYEESVLLGDGNSIE